jgi:hypothetical protein
MTTLHNRPTTPPLALALALTAIAAPAAAAQSAPNPPTPVSRQPAVQIVRISDHNGFDWGDAGIGAVGGVGLSMLAIGGGLLVTSMRRPDPAVQRSNKLPATPHGAPTLDPVHLNKPGSSRYKKDQP